MKSRTPSGKFISPLVRSIAAREGISYSDLDKITGTGMDGRITKDDILKLLKIENSFGVCHSRKCCKELKIPQKLKNTVKAENAVIAENDSDTSIPSDYTSQWR